ncbi:VWA domain-containing protein [Paraburkholderia sp. RCC_158]|uniref:TadE/TadG family type IV pilus assembly protein n=1 Tax=Paraburkholderia sp. RCC_158 TaxID=3239220 RepID=UPI003525BED2
MTSEPRTLSALLQGDEGAITVVFAFCATLMIGSMCTAIDTIHYQMTQTRVQMALDVATLSSGINLLHYSTTTGSNLTQWQADARAYYNANMPSGYMEFSMPDAQFSASVTGQPSTGQTIKLAATGSVGLLAPIIFGRSTSSGNSGSGSGSDSSSPDKVTISASNAALRMPQSQLELVLVLDNTGSMADYASSSKSQGTKIQGLRTAATDLVNDILGVQGNNSYIGLVPFTTMVNLGGSLLSSGSWISPTFAYNPKNVYMTPQTGITGSGWGGCPVEPRDAGLNLYPKAYAPKDAPGFTPFYYNVPKAGFTVTTYKSTSSGSSDNCVVQSSKTVAGVPLTLQSNGSATTCRIGSGTGIVAAWGQASQTNPGTKFYDQNGNVNGSGSPCSIAPVKFLSKDATTLKTAIGNMQAAGSTMIPTGLLWGWRMLSSTWSNSVSNGNGWASTDSTLPRVETTQGLQRVAIVLTDGENDPGSANGIMPAPSFNGLTGVGSSALKAPTVTRTDGSSLSNGSTTSVTDINAFQLAVCNAMKDDGIIIYAITFGSDASSSVAQTTMRNCASPGNYFHAPTNATLDAIFQQIAGNLGVLRLTQ